MRIRVGDAARHHDGRAGEARSDAFYEGEWWPPGHEELVAPGRVSVFAEGSVWLDTEADPWNSLDRDENAGAADVRTLFGRGALGVVMTLHGVRFTGGESAPMTGHAHIRFIATRLIVGAHVATEADVTLSYVGVSFRGLREWLTNTTQDSASPLPLVRASESEEEAGTPEEEWVRLKTMDFDGTSLLATVDNRLKSSSRYRTVYETSSGLQLENPEGLSLPEWRQEWIDPLRDLVLFATREQAVTLYLSGHTSPEDGTSIKIYEAPEVELHRPRHHPYYQRDLLPAGIWDEDGFAELIGMWRWLHETVGSIGQALFEVLNTADMPPLTRLLRLTSCAEGYHRALHDDPPFAEEEHESMVDAMINALPDDPDIRRHYRDRLRYANAISQRRRVRWMIERVAVADDRLAGRASRIASRLVDWRNANTHLEETTLAPPIEELLLLNAVLEYVIAGNILLDLEIGDNVRYCLAHGYVWDDPIAELIRD